MVCHCGLPMVRIRPEMYKCTECRFPVTLASTLRLPMCAQCEVVCWPVSEVPPLPGVYRCPVCKARIVRAVALPKL